MEPCFLVTPTFWWRIKDFSFVLCLTKTNNELLFLSSFDPLWLCNVFFGCPKFSMIKQEKGHLSWCWLWSKIKVMSEELKKVTKSQGWIPSSCQHSLSDSLSVQISKRIVHQWNTQLPNPWKIYPVLFFLQENENLIDL